MDYFFFDRAYLHYTERDYPVYFWRSQNGVEVDIMLETSRGYVAIEMKNNSRFFNTAGPVDCEDPYRLPPLERFDLYHKLA